MSPKYKVGDLLFFQKQGKLATIVEIMNIESVIDNAHIYILSWESPVNWVMVDEMDKDPNIRPANKLEKLLYGK